MRLAPFYPPLTSFWLGAAHYMLGQYTEAVPLLGECATRAPNLRSGHTWLAAACAQLGHLEDARKEAAEVLRVRPTYTINGIQRRRSYLKLSVDTEHLCDGLRKAGLPESEAAGSAVSQPASNPDEGASGSGTFEYPDSPSRGTITLRRAGSRAEPTKDR